MASSSKSKPASAQQMELTMPRKLWEHPNPKSTNMWKFMQSLNEKHGLNLKTFPDLYAYSISPARTTFWSHLFASSALIHSGTPTSIVDTTLPISDVPRWFPGISLNFAENMLYSAGAHPSLRSTAGKEDTRICATEVREGLSSIRDLTYGELRRRAGELALALRDVAGVRRGDRVVVVGANSVETMIIFIATTWLGGLFSSSSTDMGAKGILQRTVQTEPRVLFMDDVAVYNGKTVDLRPKMAEVVAGMRGEGFWGAVVVPRFESCKGTEGVEGVEEVKTWREFLGGVEGGSDKDPLRDVKEGERKAPPEFERVGFGDPFLICYSSGTTGLPKAIVHSVGGVVLNLYKEMRLHEGLGQDDVTLQFTTVGWIMYLPNVSSIVFGARTILYDGSPFVPDAKVLLRLVESQRITKLGISPRWLMEFMKRGIVPKEVADLNSLRNITCTGMVLSDQLFEWFYDTAFPKHIHLMNISGGTDFAGCFGAQNPLTPVYLGGTQGPSLGNDVRIYDSLLPDGPGQEVPHGTPGELVCVQSFPNVPCYFWNDAPSASSDPSDRRPGTRYHSAYFARFDRVWAHGDFCFVHPLTGGIYFLGRADGVLNPSGVRFGSAEIYTVIERHFGDRVADSLCVGQRRVGVDLDESVMLFLLMRPGVKFSEELVREVKAAIARDCSKRHVPRWVFETPEIPTTINLKKVELPVKQIVSGHIIKPSGTLANPQSLDYYYQFAKVEELLKKEPKAKL